MANKKISEFTETTTPAETDMLLIATDPAGADITKKVAKSNLTLKWAGQELPALESGKFLSNDGAVLSWESAGTGTVTSVAMSVPTGLSISGSPITTSGTLALSFAAGYSLPTDVKQGQWDAAYGWGDHSLEGYLKSVAMDDISDVDTSGVTDGQVLAYDDLTATWLPVDLAGGGDVVGPASATDNAIARFNTTTGKLIQNSGATLDDSNNLSIASLKASGANQLKIYNYKKTLTATDISNGFTPITITAVTRANVILFAVTANDVDGTNWAAGYGASDTGGKVTGRLTTTTNVNVIFGTDYTANDVVMVTIIEAI